MVYRRSSPGNTFQYVLTVSNNGNRAATNVVVTDQLNPRLKVNSVTAPGWDVTVSPTNLLTATRATLPIDPDSQIILDVTLTVAEVSAPAVPPGGTAPTAPDPLDNLVNKACVDADGNVDEDCDTITIPVRDLTGVVYTSCQSDAPLLGWDDPQVARRWRRCRSTRSWTPLPGRPRRVTPRQEASTSDDDTGPVDLGRPGRVAGYGLHAQRCRDRLPGLASDRRERHRSGRRVLSTRRTGLVMTPEQQKHCSSTTG